MSEYKAFRGLKARYGLNCVQKLFICCLWLKGASRDPESNFAPWESIKVIFLAYTMDLILLSLIKALLLCNLI